MAGCITIKFNLMKQGMPKMDMKSPIYIPGPVEPQFGPGRYIYFEGFSVDEKGKQHYMDATVAYRQTTLRCIEYLRRFGYSDYQVYLLLSCAPIQGHLAGLVDVRLPPVNGSFTKLLMKSVADPQRVHDAGITDRYIRFRHFAKRGRKEEGHGLLCIHQLLRRRI